MIARRTIAPNESLLPILVGRLQLAAVLVFVLVLRELHVVGDRGIALLLILLMLVAAALIAVRARRFRPKAKGQLGGTGPSISKGTGITTAEPTRETPDVARRDPALRIWRRTRPRTEPSRSSLHRGGGMATRIDQGTSGKI